MQQQQNVISLPKIYTHYWIVDAMTSLSKNNKKEMPFVCVVSDTEDCVEVEIDFSSDSQIDNFYAFIKTTLPMHDWKEFDETLAFGEESLKRLISEITNYYHEGKSHHVIANDSSREVS